MMNVNVFSALLIILLVACGAVFASDNDTSVLELNNDSNEGIFAIEGNDIISDDGKEDVNGSDVNENEGMDEDYESIINENMGIQEDDIDDVGTGDDINSNEGNLTSINSDDNSSISQSVANATGNPVLLLILAIFTFGFGLYGRNK